MHKVTLENNDPMEEVHQQNVTVVFDVGVAVQVADRGGYMHVVVVAPPAFWVRGQKLEH